LRAALSAEVRAALDAIETRDAPVEKAVHRARVRLKRARALARVGAAGAPGLASVFNDSARACMRALAPVRDADALVQAARQAAHREGGKAGKALAAVAAHLGGQRQQVGTRDLDAVRVGLRDLLAFAQVWPEASPRQIARGARRVARRARRARKSAIASQSLDARHVWRKREKERLYVAEILGGAWPGARKRRAAKRLGAALGRERDLLLLAERLREAAPADDAAAGRAITALRRRGKRLARCADKLGGKLKGV
jgi:CHAD domain-containing protein